MFSYTKKEVVMLAQELNVQKQTLERVLRLIDVLKFINTDEYLKEKLALKEEQQLIYPFIIVLD